MKRLALYVKPFWINIFIATFAGIGCSVATVCVINILKQIIDMSVGMVEEKGVIKLLVSTFLIVIMGMISNWLVVIMTGNFGAGLLKRLREDLVYHIMEITPDFMDKNNYGDIMARLSSDIEVVASYMQTYFKDCLYVPIVVIVFAGYLIKLNWKLSIICLLPLIILVPLSIKLLGPVKFCQSEYVRMLGLTNNNIKEAFDGVEVIKAYNLQNEMIEKYYLDLGKTFDVSNENDLRQYNVLPVTSMIREVPVAIALGVSGLCVLNGNMSIGIMVAYISAIKRLIEPLDNAYQLVVRTQMAMISVKRVFDLMDIPKEDIEVGKNIVNRNVENVFTFKNVSFAYGENEKMVLENVSFEIKKGSKTAIIGKSGSGKSTILKLLCRQYEVERGEIFYCNESFLNLSTEFLRNEIALISQEAIIFPLSVYDNIRIGKPSATNDEIVCAAKKSGCDEFIMSLKNGYETLLVEGGNNLSGGQKQRICIARAILKDAQVFILDEPTASLDVENEEKIMKTIEEISKGKTVVMVAHRLRTIENYDEVIVIEAGKRMVKGNG